jgi:hypothetical protein
MGRTGDVVGDFADHRPERVRYRFAVRTVERSGYGTGGIGNGSHALRSWDLPAALHLRGVERVAAHLCWEKSRLEPVTCSVSGAMAYRARLS